MADNYVFSEIKYEHLLSSLLTLGLYPSVLKLNLVTVIHMSFNTNIYEMYVLKSACFKKTQYDVTDVSANSVLVNESKNSYTQV